MKDTPEKVIGRKRRKWVKATENSTIITQADQHKCGNFHPMQHNTFQESFHYGIGIHYVTNNDAQNYAL